MEQTHPGKTFTLTFGDRAENHKGMQMLGEGASEGFTGEDLQRTMAWFQQKGATPNIYNLNLQLPEGKVADQAYLLVIPGGLRYIMDPDALYREQDVLPKDTKAYMFGSVKEKHARHNLCFGETSQKADFENGKGTVFAFDELPLLKQLREIFPEIIGEKGRGLVAEGNYYFDITQCYIGFHGDSERKKVIGVRLGAPFPLYYQWYERSEPIGYMGGLVLNHGDIYVMSEKTVGWDWLKKKTVPTLRHAAGPLEKVVKKKKK